MDITITEVATNRILNYNTILKSASYADDREGVGAIAEHIFRNEISKFYNIHQMTVVASVAVKNGSAVISHLTGHQQAVEQILVPMLTDCLEGYTVFLNADMSIVAITATNNITTARSIQDKNKLLTSTEIEELVDGTMYFVEPCTTTIVSKDIEQMTQELVDGKYKAMLINGIFYRLGNTSIMYILIPTLFKPQVGTIRTKAKLTKEFRGSSAELAFWYFLAKRHPEAFEILRKNKYDSPFLKVELLELMYQKMEEEILGV